MVRHSLLIDTAVAALGIARYDLPRPLTLASACMLPHSRFASAQTVNSLAWCPRSLSLGQDAIILLWSFASTRISSPTMRAPSIRVDTAQQARVRLLMV